MKKRVTAIVLRFALLVAAASPAAADTSAGRWLDEKLAFPGTDDRVRVLATVGQGENEALIMGGEFTFAGSARAMRIARFAGGDWAPLGEGFTDGDGAGAVNAIVRFDDAGGGGSRLVAGGSFFYAGGGFASNVAAWNGTAWAPLAGGGTDGEVFALAVFDDGTGSALYAAGDFRHAGTATARSVAKWDGARWTALGAGIDGRVTTLAVFDDGGGAALFAGGEFAFAGTGAASRVAKWDGATWTRLGTGANGTVHALSVHDDGAGTALYAAGAFTTAGSAPAAHVARWNGASWSAVGAGLDGLVLGLRSVDLGGGALLVAVGGVRQIGPTEANGIALWNGSAWAPLDPGPGRAFAGGRPATCDVFDDHGRKKLAVGGLFTGVAGVDASNAAAFDGTAWSSMGSGIPSIVSGLASFDDGSGQALYVAGRFRSAFGVLSPGVVRRRNDGSWSAVGGGGGESGGPLLVFDDGSGPALYSIRWNSDSDIRVIRWNGASWADVGAPFGGSVRFLSVHDDGSGPALYAGGFFSSPGNRVARWNGTAWESLSEAFTRPVYAMAAFDDGGGPALFFVSSSAGLGPQVLLKWDGTQLTDTGTRFSLSAESLATFDDGTGAALYAAGQLDSVNGLSVRKVARWDGAQWIDAGGGLGSGVVSVEALSILDDGSGPRLYAAAEISGDPSAHGVSRWDGAGFRPVGDGPRQGAARRAITQVLTVHVGRRGPELWAGGLFDTADGRVSRSLALWRDDLATAFRGTVNAGIGVQADVVFVNGSAGGADRRLTIGTSQALTVGVSAPPAAAGPSPFALYAFNGGAGASTATFVPGLGFTCFSTPLSGGTP